MIESGNFWCEVISSYNHQSIFTRHEPFDSKILKLTVLTEAKPVSGKVSLFTFVVSEISE